MRSVSICRLRVENHHSGFGIGHASPRISWSYSGDAKNFKQSGYIIVISRDCKDETYQEQTDQCTYIAWPSKPLCSGQLVTVKAQAIGIDGSNTNWCSLDVEVALLSPDDWKAKMISGPMRPLDTPKRPIRLRKVVHLPSFTRARLYCTAGGIYDVEINGNRVGDSVLDPGWQSYNFRLSYQTYDVSHLLRPGENRIGVYIGPGWYCGRLGGRGGRRNIWGDRMGFLGQLHLDDHVVCTTDDSWEWLNGPVLESEIFDGEIFDSKLNVSDWITSGDGQPVELIDPPRAKLMSLEMPPVKINQEIPGKKLITTPSGKTIIDFGENFVGWLRCNRSFQGQGEMMLRHAEVLEHGELGVRPLRLAKARDIIRLGGETKGWQPRFTWHGFRYAEITGVEDVQLEDFTGMFIWSDMRRSGHFSCSHDAINTLHDNTIRSLRGNFVSLPTDCPQRDERQGWTGDIQVFTSTASFIYDTTSFLSNWLEDLSAEQKSHDGIVPQIVPWLHPHNTPPRRGIWGDVAIITPWHLYQASGDTAVLRRQWNSMVQWLDKGVKRGPDDFWSPETVQYGDWLDPRAPPQFPAHGRTDGHMACNAFLVYSTGLAAEIGHIIGEEETASRLDNDYERLAKQYQHKYVTPGGRLACDSQTAFTLTLHFRLADGGAQNELWANLVERFAYLVQYEYFKIGTGFAGTPLILDTLAENGLLSLAYRMLQEKDNPSWLYSVTMGATTIWERYDSMLPDGSINPGQMTSFNHYALGSVSHFMHSVIGGLSPLEPGWKKALIKPQPGGTVRFASTSHDSPIGLYSVDWKIQDGKMKVEVRVPPNGEALVIVGGEEHIVPSGRYHFEVDWTDDPEWPPKGIAGPQSTKMPDEYIP